MTLLILSLAPVFILLSYIYFRDKYEKEPVGMILKGLVAGGILLIPAAYIEDRLSALLVYENSLGSAAYTAFVVAGFTEELLKFLAVYLVFFRNRQFNERYDGIVYAVSVSLGFAAVENIFYVFEHGLQTGIIRAFTAVPAHTFMGIAMGYYFGLARFYPATKNKHLVKALLVPWLLHALYDFILLSQHPLLLTIFIPLMVFMAALSNSEMKKHQRNSAFNPASDAFAETPGENQFHTDNFHFKNPDEDKTHG